MESRHMDAIFTRNKVTGELIDKWMMELGQAMQQAYEDVVLGFAAAVEVVILRKDGTQAVYATVTTRGTQLHMEIG